MDDWLSRRDVHWWISTMGVSLGLAVNLVWFNFQAVMGFGLALGLNWILSGLLETLRLGNRLVNEQQQVIQQLMAELHARHDQRQDD